MINLREILMDELNRLDILKNKSVEFLKKAPEGSLYITNNKKQCQYYWRKSKEDRHGVYIKKKNKKLIWDLDQKEYTLKLLTKVEENKKYIEKILNKYNFDEGVQVYEKLNPLKQTIVHPYVLPEEDYVEYWYEYQKNEKEKLSNKIAKRYMIEDELEIITENGEKVKSKSEKILADKFKSMGIPYAYEQPVLLNGYGYVLPDFKILNKKTRKEYYWEHFGMMDDREYAEKTIKKIENYEKNGIFPGKNLIMTFETKQHPLSMRIVSENIEEFLV